ncbi:MAG: hypothetical protein AB7N80_10985 [Bdellovibrionales bacterium]
MLRLLLVFSTLLMGHKVMAQPSNATHTASTGGSQKWLALASLGLYTQGLDVNAEDAWKHQTFQSPTLKAGLLYRIGSGESHLSLGGRYEFGRSIEKISGARIETTRHVLSAMAALELMYNSIKPFGFMPYAAVGLLDKQTSRLKTAGFDHELKDDDTRAHFAVGLSVSMALTPTLRPSLTWEYEVASSLSLGLQYVF